MIDLEREGKNVIDKKIEERRKDADVPWFQYTEKSIKSQDKRLAPST